MSCADDFQRRLCADTASVVVHTWCQAVRIVIKVSLSVVRVGYRVWDHLYRGTSLIRNSALLGTYSRTVHRALLLVLVGARFLVSEKPL